MTPDILGDIPTIYRVPVCSLGDDGDQYAAFTTDRRRALAAISAMVRSDYGPGGARVRPHPQRWWTLTTNCGCGEKCPHPAEPGGYTFHEGGSDYPDLPDCEYPDLPPCGDEYAWVGVDCPRGAPGAVPVFVVDVP